MILFINIIANTRWEIENLEEANLICAHFRFQPAEMNVMEAFDRCTVKRSSSPSAAVIKMEAAERPFESANTVADSGVIVKREKLSPIRIVSTLLIYYLRCRM